MLAVYYRVYLVKIFLWIFSHLPFIGRGSGDLPKHGNNQTDLREPNMGSGKVVDLRFKQKSFRTMKDIR